MRNQEPKRGKSFVLTNYLNDFPKEKLIKIQYFIDKKEAIENKDFQTSHALIFFKDILNSAGSNIDVSKSILDIFVNNLFSDKEKFCALYNVALWDNKNTLNAVETGICLVYQNEF